MFNLGWMSEYDGRPLPQNHATPKRMLLAALVWGLFVLFAVSIDARPKPGIYRPVMYGLSGAIDTLTYVDKPAADRTVSPQRLAWYRVLWSFRVRVGL